ncbi:hypothetical protein [Alkalimonas amylolytica]|uniref:Uncharacterized protein n=1 Tax=Alkalimonas amylolytica TaxID=152573 RepID=A0A1H3ZGX5_ALKAM|nr:hypothetical protein [Alkalimonas amylolytica]SEA22554.1 hypothetical protein SAMN04488051_102169 [Alkalimonas amylolytica]
MTRLDWFSPGHPAQLLLGLAIWSLWFIAMYAGLSVACQLNPPQVQQGPFTLLNAGLFILTLLVSALLFYLAWRSHRARGSLPATSQEKDPTEGAAAHQVATAVGRFIGFVSTVLYCIAAVATLAGGLPVLVMSPCS